MKMVFLCGSLEPGADGVGDYTRCLAGELIRRHHRVGVVALNDKVVEEVTNGRQEEDDVEVPVLRIPESLESRKRFAAVKEWLDSFDPQWLSLQYVPFAFQDKGLPFTLGRNLKNISGKQRFHIMFHELWVGMDAGASIKETLWGRVQRRMIHSMLKKLQPDVIHTHAGVYLAQLCKLGYEAQRLPLFSNIPVASETQPNRALHDKTRRNLTFVFFGSVYAGAPVEQFAEEAAAYAAKNGLRVKINFIGRSGAELPHWIEVWQKTGALVEVSGEQTPECVSKVLSAADFGVSTTPVVLAEKSGAIAAMSAHKLPAICLRQLRIKGLEDVPNPTAVLAYQKGNLADLLRVETAFQRTNDVQSVAEKFLSDLSK